MIVPALPGPVRALLAEVPVDLGRDEARDMARRELSKPSYDRDTPLLTRIARWILDQIERLLEAAGGALSSSLGVAAVIAVVVVLAAVIILRAGPLARSGRQRPGAVLPPQRLTAMQYRAAADEAARRTDWKIAVVERFRAIVAGLDERGVLDVRSGRTADEVAQEAGVALTDLAERLRAGATLFDAVRYGGAAAGAGDDDELRRLDSDTQAARPGPARRPEAGPTLAVPR